MGKKGEMSSVFKYIFAVVAGALFLSFFVGFAMQHKNQQTTIETGRTVFGFDDLLTLFSTSEDSSMTYPEQGFPSTVTLTIKDGKITSGAITKTTTKLVFSREQIKGKQIYLWTKRWKMPFIVDSFFYISDGRVPTYIIYDADSEELAKELTDKFSGFPKAFDVDKYKESQLDSKALSALRARAAEYTKIRFIVMSSKTPDLKGFSNAETVKVRPAEIGGEMSWDYGTVEFEDGESSYVGKEMLIGSMVAENRESYEKTKENAFEKMRTMAKIYKEKTDLLERTCPGAYALIAQALDSLARMEPTTRTELGAFAQKTEALKEMNREFEAGCPEVF